MLLITDNIKQITKATPPYKFSATITTPITVNLSRYCELGKVTIRFVECCYCSSKIYFPLNSQYCARNFSTLQNCNNVMIIKKMWCASVREIGMILIPQYAICICNNIIANHGFESASFLSKSWFNDATFACLY